MHCLEYQCYFLLIGCNLRLLRYKEKPMTEEKKLLHVLVDAQNGAIKVSDKYPLVKFYKIGPGVEYQCYSCREKAVMMADLGPSSFPSCAKHDHMERAADFVWHVVTLFAKKDGYGETDEEISRFVSESAAKLLEDMGFKGEDTSAEESAELHLP